MKQLFLLLILFSVMHTSEAQVLARIQVKAGKVARTDIPLSISLKDIAVADNLLAVEEVSTGKRVLMFCQVEQGTEKRLWWIAQGTLPAGKTRVYEVVKRTLPSQAPRVQLKDENGALTISGLLQYNYRTVYPPAGIDTVFRRSGFIHPLWAPNQGELTNMQPKDHYHHFGIWNPWTDTKFEGEEVDFWNLYKKQGTVRFAGFRSKTEGAVWGGFSALQDHIVFKKDQVEKTALHEILDIRAYNNEAHPETQTWDFVSTQSCATSSPILLKQYRYGGGFNLRGNGDWNPNNSTILTSEGHTRKDADSTTGRWIKITGDTKKGRAGLLIMAHPSDYNFPVPLRVWPDKDQNGQVAVFFTPTKTKSWEMQPGQQYVQRYRVMVYNGDLTPGQAEAAWQDYAYPPEVTVKLIR